MEEEVEDLLKRADKGREKGKEGGLGAPSALLLSSFSIYCQLAGNIKRAYLL